jgi:hypothetical protein
VMSLNHSTAIFLINKSVRAVVGIYEAQEKPGDKPVPRTTFKTLDPTIKVGDFVLVPTGTRHLMSVNKIVEVDVEVDLESSVQMAWIISVVDKSEYDHVKRMEDNAISQIRSAEKRKKQDDLRAALLKDNPLLETLSLSDMSAPAATPPSPPPSYRAPETRRDDDLSF